MHFWNAPKTNFNQLKVCWTAYGRTQKFSQEQTQKLVLKWSIQTNLTISEQFALSCGTKDKVNFKSFLVK